MRTRRREWTRTIERAKATHWKEFLDKANIWYTVTRHSLAFRALDVAIAEHLSPRKLAKTVVYATRQGYGFAVIPADCLVSMSMLGRLLNDHSLRLANETELGQLFEVVGVAVRSARRALEEERHEHSR